MKVAIVGSRDFPKLKKVGARVNALYVVHGRSLIIVSGGARGVDSAAEHAAEHLGVKTDIFPADWDKYGRRAGMIRNEHLVKASDRVIAFWDGDSKGTKHAIDIALRTRTPVEVVFP